MSQGASFDVHGASASGGFGDEVGLAAQERRNLQYVGDFGDGVDVFGFVDVGHDRKIRCRLHLGENLQTGFHARSAIGRMGGPVGLVERRLEDDGHAAARRDLGQRICMAQGGIARLDNAGAGQQEEFAVPHRNGAVSAPGDEGGYVHDFASPLDTTRSPSSFGMSPFSLR
jgi:hypothetical protein